MITFMVLAALTITFLPQFTWPVLVVVGLVLMFVGLAAYRENR